MENKEIASTLNDIRNMMERSSKFLSLSGLSAIFVGIYAFIGLYVTSLLLGSSFVNITFDDIRDTLSTPYRLQQVVLLSVVLVAISILTVFVFSWLKAKKVNRRLALDPAAVRLLWNFFTPLVSGGILCIALLFQQQYGFITAIMLIFYGIALINGSKYTYSNARYLGYAELVLGLIDGFVLGYGLLFWMIGFGLLHIIYGILFYLKYDLKGA